VTGKSCRNRLWHCRRPTFRSPSIYPIRSLPAGQPPGIFARRRHRGKSLLSMSLKKEKSNKDSGTSRRITSSAKPVLSPPFGRVRGSAGCDCSVRTSCGGLTVGRKYNDRSGSPAGKTGKSEDCRDCWSPRHAAADVFHRLLTLAPSVVLLGEVLPTGCRHAVAAARLRLSGWESAWRWHCGSGLVRPCRRSVPRLPDGCRRLVMTGTGRRAFRSAAERSGRINSLPTGRLTVCRGFRRSPRDLRRARDRPATAGR